MMQGAVNRRTDYIGQIQDRVQNINPLVDPFLYYLPVLLTTEPFLHINAEKALSFTKIALRPEPPPIIADARNILNQLVNPHDGSLITPGPDVFYGNQNFFWRELGGRVGAIEIILHVLNKTLFVSSVGQRSTP